MLTAFGDLSRNRTTGKRIANGEKIEDITASTTVEGKDPRCKAEVDLCIC